METAGSGKPGHGKDLSGKRGNRETDRLPLVPFMENLGLDEVGVKRDVDLGRNVSLDNT